MPRVLTRALIGAFASLIKGQSGADRRRAQSCGISGEPAREAAAARIRPVTTHKTNHRWNRRDLRNAPTASAECGIDFVVPIAAPGYRNILSVRPYAIDATPLRYHHRRGQNAPDRGPSRPLRPSRAPHIPSIDSTQADEAETGKKLSIPFSICACHPCAGAMLIFSVSLCGKTVIRVFLDAVRE